MLVRFRIKNFRSFYDEQELTYVPSADRSLLATHTVQTASTSVPRLSTTAIVLGPNGSGKTMLLTALQTLQSMVLHSTSFSNAELAELYTPFRFKPDENEPTAFEVELIIAEIRYRYAISFDAKRIRTESLHVYKSVKSQRWIARSYDVNLQNEGWAPFSPALHGARESWRKATRPTALFLTTAIQLNAHQLKPLALWFKHCLDIVTPRGLLDPYRISALVNNVPYRRRILELLTAVGLPTDDARLTENGRALLERRTAPALSTTRRVSETPSVEFLHTQDNAKSVWIPWNREGAGIQRLFVLFGHILTATQHGRILVIDEFDVGLHPLVARYIIQLLNKPAGEEKRAQVLLTSHTTELLDLELIRRDEIWLIDKDVGDASRLSRLSRSSPRKNELVAKGYLRGRYGAIPIIHREFDLALEDRHAADALRSSRRARAKPFCRG